MGMYCYDQEQKYTQSLPCCLLVMASGAVIPWVKLQLTVSHVTMITLN